MFGTTLVTRKARWLAVAAALIAFVVATWIGVSRAAAPYVRAELIRGLGAHLDGEVAVDEIRIRLLPVPAISGRRLTVRHRGRTDVPPLISVESFSASTGWRSVLGRHLSLVRLDGLEVTIPPRQERDRPPSANDGASSGPLPLTLGRIESTGARLAILSRRPERDPMVWEILSLTVDGFAFDRPSRFTASLTNPVPEGRIEATGAFGPWMPGEPALTPVAGDYRFRADLGTIKGIAGILASEGRFTGPIERISAAGTAVTPDFRIPELNAAAQPLETSFDAVVDGTNGDVELPRVDAMLGGSRLRTRGAIAGTKGIKGKRVTLEVTSGDAKIEDLLGLVVKSGSPMTGTAALTAAFDLPPGETDVVERVGLKGRVTIAEARFRAGAIQDKVDELSRRGQGRPGDASIDDVASDLGADFSVSGGVARLTGVTYAVRGARIELNGTYTLAGGALDFAGAARLDASVSDTMTGLRHFLLMPLDPLFRKGGAGTRLAIAIRGTAERPEVTLDVGRTLRGQ